MEVDKRVYFIKAPMVPREYTNEGGHPRPLYKKLQLSKNKERRTTVYHGPQQPPGQGSTQGPKKTHEAMGRQSQAYHIGPLDSLHRYCV